jgi:D-alanyl-lipoteichoic acid acyltransferase DltB (MBOAT superfamily)
VAGPIERAQNLLYQFRLKFDFEYGRAVSGLKQMLWGFFKKVVIADRVGVIVDMAYNSPGDYDGLALALATVLFAFQIYCDFSGYSDIAIGASKVLGIKLMDNFRTPYFSKDISEFWKRWHISLSTWFRDYLYIPLGGNRVVKWRWYYNLMIVFLVSGFWHGANWTFIIWGGLHGLYLVMAIVFEDVNKKLAQVIGLTKSKFLHKWVNIAITFALVLFAWIYFRANSATDGHLIVQKILSLSSGSEHSLILYIADGKVLITIALLGLFALSDSYVDSLIKQKRTLSRTPSLILYAAMMVIILIAGNFGEVNFLYFQF